MIFNKGSGNTKKLWGFIFTVVLQKMMNGSSDFFLKKSPTLKK